CMPRQMPKTGAPRASASCSSLLKRAARSIPRPNAATPGRTIRGARAIEAGSSESGGSAPARTSACSTEPRLPRPRSTTATFTVALHHRAGSQDPFGARHRPGDARVERSRLPQRAGEGFEDRLRAVVEVAAAEQIDVHVGPRLVGHGLEESLEDAQVHRAARALVERDVPVQEAAAGEIDHAARQRFVEGKIEAAGAGDAGAIARRLIDGAPQRDAGVLDGVVLIDVQIALAGDARVESGVLRQRLE